MMSHIKETHFNRVEALARRWRRQSSESNEYPRPATREEYEQPRFPAIAQASAAAEAQRKRHAAIRAAIDNPSDADVNALLGIGDDY